MSALRSMFFPTSSSRRGASPRPTGPGRRPSGLASVVLACLAVWVAGCGDDGTGPGEPARGDLGVVLNSIDLSLSVFPVDSPQAVRPPIGLAPAGSPVSLAVRGDRAAVPLGTAPAVTVVDLGAGEVERTFSLPEGSGATGVAFVHDTLLLVTNPNLGSVSPVNLRTGVVGDPIAAGSYPQEVVVAGDRVLVLDSRLGDDFQPEGPGVAIVLDAGTLAHLGSVQLSGVNPGGGTVGADGRVYVVHSGTFGQGNGSLSVVDPVGLAEIAHHEGFGDFPFAVAQGPGGALYVASFSYGVAVWSPGSASFVRGPGDAVEPGGVPSASGLGFDGAGRLFTLLPECGGPGEAFRLGPDFQVEASFPVGTCPVAIGFGSAEGAG